MKKLETKNYLPQNGISRRDFIFGASALFIYGFIKDIFSFEKDSDLFLQDDFRIGSLSPDNVEHNPDGMDAFIRLTYNFRIVKELFLQRKLPIYSRNGKRIIYYCTSSKESFSDQFAFLNTTPFGGKKYLVLHLAGGLNKRDSIDNIFGIANTWSTAFSISLQGHIFQFFDHRIGSGGLGGDKLYRNNLSIYRHGENRGNNIDVPDIGRQSIGVELQSEDDLRNKQCGGFNCPNETQLFVFSLLGSQLNIPEENWFTHRDAMIKKNGILLHMAHTDTIPDEMRSMIGMPLRAEVQLKFDSIRMLVRKILRK